jgi:putative Mg2+ transporter-C (MgtC) family protein
MHIEWGFLLDSVVKLTVAGVLAGFVGWEREAKHRPAGIRTHMLVCSGATLICIVSSRFAPESHVADPARIAAQIVSGIGFLGAGTIMRQGSIVVGLTTAASLWSVAAIGMAVSLGGTFYLVAVFATAALWAALIVMRRIEKALGHEWGNMIEIEGHVEQDQVTPLLEFIDRSGVALSSLTMTEIDHPKGIRVGLKGQVPRSQAPADVMQMLLADDRISKVGWATTRFQPTTAWLRVRRGDDTPGSM